jgi:flagellar hook-associated protein 2
MGSPITFSGFNKIDWNTILDAVMAQESQPLTRMETQKRNLETQNTAYSTLAGKLSTLQDAADALRDTESLALLTASSSDTGVGVTATGGTVTGAYTIAVTNLAKAQVLASSSTYGALTDVVATSGTLTLTPTTGPAVPIALSGSTTLQGLVDAINAETDSPVAASAVQVTPGSYKLMLTSKETGTANGFTVTSTLAGGSGLTFAAGDGDGTYGEVGENTQEAENAALTVNGLAVTSSTNTVADVIPGVTVTLEEDDVTATVTVGRDLDAAETVINKFITAYNDIVTFTKDQTSAAVAGRASIAREPVLRSFRDSLSAALRDTYASGGTLTALGMVGVGFDMNGKLTLDADVLEDALTDAPLDVQGLFSGTDGTGGVFGTINTLIDGYTQAGGLVDDAQERIDDQVTTISKRLDTMELLLMERRKTLQMQYIAADLAISRLNRQSASLSGIGSQYSLF